MGCEVGGELARTISNIVIDQIVVIVFAVLPATACAQLACGILLFLEVCLFGRTLFTLTEYIN